VKLEASKKQEA